MGILLRRNIFKLILEERTIWRHRPACSCKIPWKAIFSILTPPISFDRAILELYLFHPHVSVIFKILMGSPWSGSGL